MHRLKRAFDNPLSTYYIIAGSTLLLLVIGVVMVTSASSIESFRVFGSAYTLAQRQGKCVTFMPRWNSLSLFAVPAGHAVSLVSPWAEGERLAITGWMLL